MMAGIECEQPNYKGHDSDPAEPIRDSQIIPGDVNGNSEPIGTCAVNNDIIGNLAGSCDLDNNPPIRTSIAEVNTVTQISGTESRHMDSDHIHKINSDDNDGGLSDDSGVADSSKLDDISPCSDGSLELNLTITEMNDTGDHTTSSADHNAITVSPEGPFVTNAGDSQQVPYLPLQDDLSEDKYLSLATDLLDLAMENVELEMMNLLNKSCGVDERGDSSDNVTGSPDELDLSTSPENKLLSVDFSKISETKQLDFSEPGVDSVLELSCDESDLSGNTSPEKVSNSCDKIDDIELDLPESDINDVQAVVETVESSNLTENLISAPSSELILPDINSRDADEITSQSAIADDTSQVTVALSDKLDDGDNSISESSETFTNKDLNISGNSMQDAVEDSCISHTESNDKSNVDNARELQATLEDSSLSQTLSDVTNVDNARELQDTLEHSCVSEDNVTNVTDPVVEHDIDAFSPDEASAASTDIPSNDNQSKVVDSDMEGFRSYRASMTRTADNDDQGELTDHVDSSNNQRKTNDQVDSTNDAGAVCTAVNDQGKVKDLAGSLDLRISGDICHITKVVCNAEVDDISSTTIVNVKTSDDNTRNSLDIISDSNSIAVPDYVELNIVDNEVDVEGSVVEETSFPAKPCPEVEEVILADFRISDNTVTTTVEEDKPDVLQDSIDHCAVTEALAEVTCVEFPDHSLKVTSDVEINTAVDSPDDEKVLKDCSINVEVDKSELLQDIDVDDEVGEEAAIKSPKIPADVEIDNYDDSPDGPEVLEDSTTNVEGDKSEVLQDIAVDDKGVEPAIKSPNIPADVEIENSDDSPDGPEVLEDSTPNVEGELVPQDILIDEATGEAEENTPKAASDVDVDTADESPDGQQEVLEDLLIVEEDSKQDVSKEELQNEVASLRRELKESQQTTDKTQSQLDAQKQKSHKVASAWKQRVYQSEVAMRRHCMQRDQQLGQVISQLLFLEGQLRKEQLRISEVLAEKDKIIQEQKLKIDELKLQHIELLSALSSLRTQMNTNGFALGSDATSSPFIDKKKTIDDELFLDYDGSTESSGIFSLKGLNKFNVVKNKLRRHRSNLELYNPESTIREETAEEVHASQEDLTDSLHVNKRKYRERCRSIAGYPLADAAQLLGFKDRVDDEVWQLQDPDKSLSLSDSRSAEDVFSSNLVADAGDILISVNDMPVQDVDNLVKKKNKHKNTNIHGSTSVHDVSTTSSEFTSDVPTSPGAQSTGGESNPFKNFKSMLKRKGSKMKTKKRGGSLPQATAKEYGEALRQHSEKQGKVK